MATKFASKGLDVKFGAANPPTATIGQLGDSTIDFGERDALIDVTTHDNTSGVADMLDNGFKTPFSVSGEILLDPDDTVHEAIRAAHASGATNYLKLTLPNTGAAVLVGAVRVKSFSVPEPVKGKLAANVVFEGLAAATYTQ